jgi:hypothetical protein
MGKFSTETPTFFGPTSVMEFAPGGCFEGQGRPGAGDPLELARHLILDVVVKAADGRSHDEVGRARK